MRDDPKHQFYFFRFMLGFFEGGFFPSVIMYLSLWYRGQDRAKAIAMFMAAIPLSSAFGLPLSGLLLNVNWFGLSGWRWIFIVEGILPILAGFAVLFCLPDRPDKVDWLPADEKKWLLDELEKEHLGKKVHGHFAWMSNLGMVFLLTCVYFCLNVYSYGLSMFMPAIIKSQSGVSSETAIYLAMVPYLFAFFAMIWNGWHSDKTNERVLHVSIPLVLSGTCLALAAFFDGTPYVPAMIMIFCVGTCLYAHLPAFWPIPTMFLGAATAASAIGFINMIGNLGGFFGPNIVGKLSNQVGNAPVSFAPALFKLAPWAISAGLIVLTVGLVKKTKRPVEGD
jgi:ACS family tartrate transporter-like MFS transporter